MADTFEVRGDIEFDPEVKSIVWDDAAQIWEIVAQQPDGSCIWRANVEISAVGLLSRPNVPELPGIDEFGGEWFHTARWPAHLDLAGKRVAVIGTGCTGYQLVPEVVKEAEHVFVFQRTPNWVYEAPGYLAPYPDQVNWMDRNFPYLSCSGWGQIGSKPMTDRRSISVLIPIIGQPLELTWPCPSAPGSRMSSSAYRKRASRSCRPPSPGSHGCSFARIPLATGGSCAMTRDR